jgi:hypothetical protein
MITQIIIDDFHPVAKPIAAFAKTLSYGPQEWEGHTYRGIGLGYSPELFYDLLVPFLGRKPEPKMEFFRLGTKEEAPTTYIHADNACAKHAAVWYLSEPPADLVSGTAFWQHRASDKYELSEKDREDHDFILGLDADGADESKWKMVGLCGHKFNRCVVYPSNIFHSRYPKDAWGKDAADGRIVFTSFFD